MADVDSTPNPCPRTRSIRQAITTSLVSKLGTLILRLVSIPVAIQLLGMDRFGIYAGVLVLVQLIDLLYSGVGSVVTREISRAVARGDREAQIRSFANGFVLNAGATMIFGTLLGLVFLLVDPLSLFGHRFEEHIEEVCRASWVALFLVALKLCCVVAVRAFEGYMETRIFNSWGALGNFVAAGALIFGLPLVPTVEFLIIIVEGTQAMILLSCLVHLAWKRPWLFGEWKSHVSSRGIATLWREGIFFNITYSCSLLIEINLVTWLIGKNLGPEQVGNFSVLVTLFVSASGFIQMVLSPTWPTLLDAQEKNDTVWAAQAVRKIRWIMIIVALLAFGFFASFGHSLIQWWAGPEWTISRVALIFYGVYQALAIWRSTNQMILLSLNRVRSAAAVIVVESLLLATVVSVLLSSGCGFRELFLAMAACLTLISAHLFPLLYRRYRVA